MSADPGEFFKPSRGKWSAERYENRTPLSTIVGRNVRLARAATGTKHWQQGFLLVEDAETGELLAVVMPSAFRDPETGWVLRLDC